MLSYSDLLNYAQAAGFTGSSANTIAAIAEAESGGDPYAYNPNDPGGSYGVLQENAGAHGDAAFGTWGDPANAFAQAFDISQGGTNFSPWSTYNSGAYTQFMPSNSSNVPTNPDGSPCSALQILFGCGTPEQVGNYNQNQTNTPGTIENNLTQTGKDAQSGVSAIGKFFSFITSGAGWERIGVVMIGLILLIVGGFMLAQHRTVNA